MSSYKNLKVEAKETSKHNENLDFEVRPYLPRHWQPQRLASIILNVC